jgi:hypothetical protein
MQESKSINKSLFELGRVVESLNQKQANVIYRNSSLTRLLQDALGGTSVSIVCPWLIFQTFTNNNFYFHRYLHA